MTIRQVIGAIQSFHWTNRTPARTLGLMDRRLGIRENWAQFWLLVLINACVGGMVGLERTVVPLVETQEFHLTSDTLIFSFIVAFGLVKALSNVASGSSRTDSRARRCSSRGG